MTAIEGKPNPLLLKEKAYLEIRKAILTEVFTPGEFLSERKLIDYLDMSKTPIKSAIDRLETEGFVQVAPKQGIIVKELSMEKARDIFELRLAIEQFVCEKVAGQLKPQELEAINENLSWQRSAISGQDELSFTNADSAFHQLLSECSGNKEIAAVMANNQAHLYRSALRIIRRTPNRMEAAYDEHRRLFEKLRDGDEEGAKRLIREHITFGKAIFAE